jgi:hypothetical protein
MQAPVQPPGSLPRGEGTRPLAWRVSGQDLAQVARFLDSLLRRSESMPPVLERKVVSSSIFQRSKVQ